MQVSGRDMTYLMSTSSTRVNSKSKIATKLYAKCNCSTNVQVLNCMYCYGGMGQFKEARPEPMESTYTGEKVIDSAARTIEICKSFVKM